MFVLESLKTYAQTGRIALVNREESLTFAQLDARSDAFAAWLLQRFGEDRTPILIYGEKETDFLSCIIGALKSGRGYVPIDRSTPPDRAARIAAEVRPKVIVNFGGFAYNGETLILEAAQLDEILRQPCAPVSSKNWIDGETPAYILFTSGSTGNPKGVPITVGNLTSFYQGVLPWYLQLEYGVVLNQVSYSFDVSGCSIYAGLARGMTLYTVDHQMTQNLAELFDRLKSSGLTMWVSTPSFAEICVRSQAFRQELLPGLRQFLFCGEILTHTLCDELAGRFPAARVFNTYGPTEATVLVTAVEVTEEMCRSSDPIPIGRAIEGTELYLVNDQGQRVAGEGQQGELIILGKSVGSGYFGCPDLTEKSFFVDNKTGERAYRTGDLCYQKNGLYYYCGRADNQLKLGGYRIELEDIERNLEKLPNVARAAVVPVREGEKVSWLAAFLLLKEPDGLTNLKRTIQIKKQAAEYLPAYMIPRKIAAVESFPLNVNGKVDKKALLRLMVKEETP